MPASSPSERRLIARAAAHQSWAATPNRTARTATARPAFLAKFEDQVDPDRVLAAEERAKRATNARKAYFADLARKSAAARRSASSRRQALEEFAAATRLLADLTELGRSPSELDRQGPTAEAATQTGGGVR